MHLDTHVVGWLYHGRMDRIPKAARTRIDTERLEISPIVELELAYLYEVGKASEPPGDVLVSLGSSVGLAVSTAPFQSVISAAVGLTWTRDPFDRLIAAQALAENTPLLTADRMIRKHLPLAVWDGSDS